MVSNSKKRPNNVIIGRTFDKKVLDMVELGLLEFKSQQEFTNSLTVPSHSRPLVIFNGDVFGYNSPHMKLHNLFCDFFYENVRTDGIASSSELSLIVAVTADENQLSITAYQRQLIPEEGLMKVEEIGPRCVFEIRRQKWADDEAFKKACKQPKPKKKPHVRQRRDSLAQERLARWDGRQARQGVRAAAGPGNAGVEEAQEAAAQARGRLEKAGTGGSWGTAEGLVRLIVFIYNNSIE